MSDLMQKIQQGRQYRNVKEIRSDAVPFDEEKRYRVRGYATTYNEPYTLYSDDDIEIREQVAPEAFEKADMSDVIMQYNHEGRVFARTRNNTLSLTSDEHGLLIEADLGGTEIGRQLFDEIDGGYTDRMSFGFTVDADEVSEEREKGKRTIYLRTITRIGKLYDVSAVSIPANDGTEISARSLVDGLIEKEKAERLIEAEKEARARAKAELELELELIRR
jgi:HK97 family phage prohead protease